MPTVYFATNRNQIPAEEGYFGERFHHDGPHFYRVGAAELAPIPKKKGDYTLASVDVLSEKAPDTKGSEKAVYGSAKLFEDMQRQMRAHQNHAIVYFHGFNTSFERSLMNAALIQDNFRTKDFAPYVFVFSWPSNGRVTPPWEYFSDRDDAAASGVAMARALMRFIDFLRKSDTPCHQRIHLIAHSMGNWALRHMLKGLRTFTNSSRLPKIFDQALLMASDEDEDALEQTDKLGSLPEIARAVHVYHNQNDLALLVSDKTKFNPDRLGIHGPRTFSGISSRINSIDCSLVDKGSFFDSHHNYFLFRKEVIDDARAVLQGVIPPDKLPHRSILEPFRRYRLDPAKAGK